MTAKEFALAQIAPYYLDPSICGVDEVGCRYFTDDGKMCVLGKNLINPEQFKDVNIRACRLLTSQDESILKEESRGILKYHEWDYLQGIHDHIATTGGELENYNFTNSLFTLQELKQYCETLKTNQNG